MFHSFTHGDGSKPVLSIHIVFWLVVWTPLKNIGQLGWIFPIYGKKKCSSHHQPVLVCFSGRRYAHLQLPATPIRRVLQRQVQCCHVGDSHKLHIRLRPTVASSKLGIQSIKTIGKWYSFSNLSNIMCSFQCRKTFQSIQTQIGNKMKWPHFGNLFQVVGEWYWGMRVHEPWNSRFPIRG